MPASGVAGGFSVASVLFYATTLFDNGAVNVTDLPVVEMPTVLTDDTDCDFFNFTRRYGADHCNVFAASRLTSTTIREAATRALTCMAAHELECVLGPEVGLGLPSVFLADAAEGVRVVIGPRFTASETPKLVRVLQPNAAAPTTLVLNSSVSAEFVTESRQVHMADFEGSDAFCLSLLRVAFVDSCFVNS